MLRINYPFLNNKLRKTALYRIDSYKCYINIGKNLLIKPCLY